MPGIGIGNSIIFKRGGAFDWEAYWASINALLSEDGVAFRAEEDETFIIQE